jgi:hypothetical protein
VNHRTIKERNYQLCPEFPGRGESQDSRFHCRNAGPKEPGELPAENGSVCVRRWGWFIRGESERGEEMAPFN